MDEFETITADDLKEKLESDDDFVLIDTLGDMSYQRAHLPEAISISAKDNDFVANVEAAVADKSVPVIVYCASFSCDLSPEAAQNLVDAGFENVIDYEGGLKDWVENGYELEGDDAETMAEELTEE
ncbi:MAG: rhodanese-like domain-containing protein [Parcubacteria group bacterium SW_6_46_9]|nr:MAG: rhodanese-like domain-containing protein [Parcubacteria group bacterium SW_6_46_9]